MAKTVVVTGANSGIGLSTALELAGAGYDVVGTARSEAKAALITGAAEERGVSVRTVQMDVADAASTVAGFAEIDALTGGPWAVVNNAGIAQPGAITDVSDEAIRAQLEVNVVAPMRIARIVLPGMQERGGGRIVNISSVAGRVSTPMLGWYSASKFALEAASDALRAEVAQLGIKVMLVEPGTFGTNIWAESDNALPEDTNPAYDAAYARARLVTRNAGRYPDPVWVARTIRLALANPLPQSRYLIGADAVGSFVGERLAPTVVTDYVKQVVTGLRRLPLPFVR